MRSAECAVKHAGRRPPNGSRPFEFRSAKRGVRNKCRLRIPEMPHSAFRIPHSKRPRTSLCSRVSKTQLAWGSTRAACRFSLFLGPWQKSDAPALQAGSNGSVTRRSPPFHCGENEIQASLISSASVGATPTPATNLGEVFRLRVCKIRVLKKLSEVTTGALPAPPTIPDP
jgi:hypothetical protein